MQEKLWYIKSAQIFSGMKPHDHAYLSELARMVPFKRDEIIYLPDDLSHYVYLVKKGRVKLSRIDIQGREVTLDIIGPMDIFGELALADEATRSHTATALEEGLLCIFSKQNFKKVMDTYPYFGLAVVKLIGLRMRKLESRLEDLAFRSVSERVTDTLLRLAKEFGRQEADGAVRVPITQSQLANLVGASREKVAEELGKLRREGVVNTAYRAIILQNHPGAPRNA